MGLTQVLDLLCCPLCNGHLAVAGSGGNAVACDAGHSFDMARQGHLTLGRGRARHTGDTAAMVMARDRVHTSGLFEPVRSAIIEAVPNSASTVLEIGAGTGYYLAGAVAATGDRRGIGIDTSKAALKRLAVAHPAVAAVGADATDRLPVADAGFDCCLVVFSPRPVPEIERVVTADGVVIVATPTPDHLSELLEPMGMLDVPAGKVETVTAQFGSRSGQPPPM